MKVVVPLNTARITEVIKTDGKTYVNIVLKDGTPKTVKQ